MPTYEYVCKECDHHFEVFLKMSDEPIKTCPKCGKSVRQILSGGLGVNFKGSGFYVNEGKGKKQSCSASSKCSSCPGCSSGSCSS